MTIKVVASNPPFERFNSFESLTPDMEYLMTLKLTFADMVSFGSPVFMATPTKIECTRIERVG